jgi:hypothetical protein
MSNLTPEYVLVPLRSLKDWRDAIQCRWVEAEMDTLLAAADPDEPAEPVWRLLEDYEAVLDWVWKAGGNDTPHHKAAQAFYPKLRAALQAADPAQGAQAEGEAVAYIVVRPDDSNEFGKTAYVHYHENCMGLPVGEHALYTHPAPQAEKGEGNVD